MAVPKKKRSKSIVRTRRSLLSINLGKKKKTYRWTLFRYDCWRKYKLWGGTWYLKAHFYPERNEFGRTSWEEHVYQKYVVGRHGLR